MRCRSKTPQLIGTSMFTTLIAGRQDGTWCMMWVIWLKYGSAPVRCLNMYSRKDVRMTNGSAGGYIRIENLPYTMSSQSYMSRGPHVLYRDDTHPSVLLILRVASCLILPLRPRPVSLRFHSRSPDLCPVAPTPLHSASAISFRRYELALLSHTAALLT